MRNWGIWLPILLLSILAGWKAPTQTEITIQHLVAERPEMMAPLCNAITDGQTIVWNASRRCWRPVTPGIGFEHYSTTPCAVRQ